MPILVTGATGFIGSQICRALVAGGQPVRAFHRPDSPQLALEGLRLEHAVGDVTQPETLAAAMRGVEGVFHTAALLGRRDSSLTYAVTVDGTRNVLQAAGEAGVRRVVHTSSVAALGMPDQIPLSREQRSGESPASALLMDETHTWNYRPEYWRYGHAKYLAELAVQAAVAQGLDVVIVNPAVVIGAGDLNRISGNIVVQVAQRRVPVSAPGGSNVVHIADVVDGHLAALRRGRRGERYILGGENLPHVQLLELIAQAAGVPPPRLVLPGCLARWLAAPLSAAEKWLPLPVKGEALRRTGYYFYYDTRKARHELGLKDARPVRQAVAEAFAWYLQQGMI